MGSWDPTTRILVGWDPTIRILIGWDPTTIIKMNTVRTNKQKNDYRLRSLIRIQFNV